MVFVVLHLVALLAQARLVYLGIYKAQARGQPLEVYIQYIWAEPRLDLPISPGLALNLVDQILAIGLSKSYCLGAIYASTIGHKTTKQTSLALDNSRDAS